MVGSRDGGVKEVVDSRRLVYVDLVCVNVVYVDLVCVDLTCLDLDHIYRGCS